MASTHQTAVRVVTRGFSQFNQRHLIEPDSAWDLLNMHQNNGRLEQTPWFEVFSTLSAGVFGSGYSPVRLIKPVYSSLVDAVQYLVINQQKAGYVASDGVTQTAIPVVLQTSKPSNATLTGECLLYGINRSNFGTLCNKITVQIVTATTFQYKLDSGAWVGPVNIQSSYTLPATSGLTVAFQGQGDVTDYSNFTPNDTWTWEVSTLPDPTVAPSTANFAFSSDTYGPDLYIGGVNRNIMRLRDDMLTSVGYSRVYGKHVAVFFGHLFVSQYAQAGSGISDTYNSATTPYTLGWSHLNNPDQFFSTLINEADQKFLPQQQFADLATQGITGLAPWRSLLYVFLADAIWNVQYVGLPNVMQLTQLNSNIGSIYQSGVVRTPQAIYFIGRNDFYKIDEFEPVPIGRKVRNKFFTETSDSQKTFGFYNSKAKEVIWTYLLTSGGGLSGVQCRQVIYNEQTDDWYFRNVPNESSGYSNPLCGTEKLYTYGQSVLAYSGKLAAEQADGATSNAMPDTSTTYGVGLFTEPYFETPYLNYGDYFHIKQSDSLYIDASYSGSGQIKVYQSPQAYVGDGVANMTLIPQSWLTSLSDQRLSLPRQAFRSNAYKFLFTAGDSSSPIYNGKFNFFQEFFLGPNLQVEK